MLDRKDKAVLAQAAVYAVLALVACVAVLLLAFVVGEAIHILRVTGGI